MEESVRAASARVGFGGINVEKPAEEDGGQLSPNDNDGSRGYVAASFRVGSSRGSLGIACNRGQGSWIPIRESSNESDDASSCSYSSGSEGY